MTNLSENGAPPALACDMSALPPDERAEHQALAAQLFGGLVRERRELVDGFAYRFDAEYYPLLATFIGRERVCCPFFTFRLELAPGHGPVWLELTASGDVKRLLLGELEQAGMPLG